MVIRVLFLIKQVQEIDLLLPYERLEPTKQKCQNVGWWCYSEAW